MFLGCPQSIILTVIDIFEVRKTILLFFFNNTLTSLNPPTLDKVLFHFDSG